MNKKYLKPLGSTHIATNPRPNWNLLSGWWTRRTWLRVAVINALAAGFVLMSPQALEQNAHGATLRQAAQIALMHAMGTVACATFMNMGARCAARVPALFAAGTLFYSVPAYAGFFPSFGLEIVRMVGALCFLIGWLYLLICMTEVDRH